MRFVHLTVLCTACLALLACSGDDDATQAPATTEDGSLSDEGATADLPGTDPDAAATDDGGTEQDVAEVAEGPGLPDLLPTGLPATADLGPPYDRIAARTIIHAHTIYSHDACDGQPVLDDAGTPNEECLQSFREALCTDHIDAIFMTEHYDRAARVANFEELFLHRAGDEWVEEDGVRVANAVVCADGHRALILPGLEGNQDGVSPIGLSGHPVEGDANAVEAAYKDASAEGVAAMRAQNAVPVAIHIEGAPDGWLSQADIDAIEVGNLHVLIAPDLRELVGLDPDGPIVAFSEWVFGEGEHPEPDLVFLEFHERMGSYHWWWDALLQERLIAGFAGNDVHQNVLPMPMSDGDRPDSYRRMMKWYVNHLAVTDKKPSTLREAIRRGQLYMVFEVLGTPVGFDFHAEAGDDDWLMGDTVPESARSGGGLRLVGAAPAALIGEASVTVQPVMRLYRIDSEQSEMVVEVEGALDFTVEKPGRYRLEIFVTPNHLQPYLAGRDDLLRELPWVYSNPIEVQ